MSLPVFFVDTPTLSSTHLLDEYTARHIVQVLRMQTGEKIQLTNGLGLLWTATLIETSKKLCLVQVEKEVLIKQRRPRKVAIAISVIKNVSRIEWFIEKATELGVAEIFFIKCARTEKSHVRLERLRQICISAMLQSKQVWLPVLHEMIAFKDFVESNLSMAYHNRLIAHCEECEKHPLINALDSSMENALLLIGPEGDFTSEEILIANHLGYVPVSLGETRLRTETAGVVGATIMCLV